MQLIETIQALWRGAFGHMEPNPKPPGNPPGKSDSLEAEQKWMAARARYLHAMKLRRWAIRERWKCRAILAGYVLSIGGLVFTVIRLGGAR